MIHVPTAPWFHYCGDLAVWIAAALGARWVYRHRRPSVAGLARQTEPGYFIALAIGRSMAGTQGPRATNADCAGLAARTLG